MLMRSPVYATAAVASLVLGIAINTTVFSVIEAAILRPLPYQDSQELRVVQDTRMTGEGDFLTHDEFVEFQRSTRSFSAVSAYRSGMAGRHEIQFEGPTGKATGVAVSPNTFLVLGVRAALGRALLPADQEEGEPVIVVSHGFWQRHLGGRREAVGGPVRVSGQVYTLVGVMPTGFWYPTEENSFWIPLKRTANSAEERALSLVGRLARRGDGAQAASEAVLVVRRFDAAAATAPPSDRWVRVATLDRARRPSDGAFFFVLQGVVVSILLIACSNVANLMLVRMVSRRRDTAIRAAIGASRWHLVRPLLAESLLIVAVSTVLGLGVSAAALRLLVSRLPDSNALPDLLAAGLNARVFVFATLAAGLCMIACTITPAFQITRPDLSEVLKEGSNNAGVGAGAGRMRGTLVVVQIAVSLVLLVNTGILVEHVRRTGAWRPGFTWQHLAQLQLRYTTQGNSRAALAQVLERVRATPGVSTVAAEARLTPPGGKIRNPDRALEVGCRCAAVTQDYLGALGIPLIRGRNFSSSDPADGTVAIIDERLAARLWPGEDAVGRQLQLGTAQAGTTSATIVGVARATEFERPRGDGFGPSLAGVYVLSPFTSVRSATLLIRTYPGIGSIAALRRAVAEADPEQPVYELQTAESVLRRALAPLRWYTAVFGLLAMLGLGLSAVGLYGLMSYGVAQRRREIGIRLALGAGRNDVVRLVARSALGLVLVGTCLGAVGGAASGKMLATILFDAGTPSAAVFLAVALVLAIVVVAAGVFPALRAARTDPAVVLQST
jgi:predicted permease